MTRGPAALSLSSTRTGEADLPESPRPLNYLATPGVLYQQQLKFPPVLFGEELLCRRFEGVGRDDFDRDLPSIRLP
jgi:hypothetical protein